MSTLVPGSIMVRDGHRDSKTKQDSPAHAEPRERERSKRQGIQADWVRIGVGVAMSTRKIEVWLFRKERRDRQTNPCFKMCRAYAVWELYLEYTLSK